MIRHWIPPGALVFSQLAHGAAWLLLWRIGAADAVHVPSFLGIAWIHVVALGWATTAALAVLVHVIPSFSDMQWRGERVARAAVALFAGGTLLFVVSLALRPTLAIGGAAIMLVALCAYTAASYATLRPALRGERVQRAVARALLVTLVFLLLTASAGVALALMLSGFATPAWVASLPAAHATLGLFGWLSLLIFGVSARTVRPITGNRSRFPAAHIIVGSLTLIGVPLLAIGVSGLPLLARVGGTLFALAALAYALDVLDVLRRAMVTHRVPQCFVLASIVWLLAALALGAGTLLGEPWQLAFVFVVLIGWIGQMLDAHIHHIGVRLIATIYRGDDDETRPQDLLDARLSWAAFFTFQIAIVLATIGLLRGDAAFVITGGIIGTIGWIVTMGNLLTARDRAIRATSLSLLQ